MSKITWNVTVQVVDGPRTVVNQSAEVEAYDKIEIRIPAGANPTIDVAAGAARVSLLLLRTKNDAYPAAVTYDVVGGAAGLVLDGPQFFNGSAIGTLLGAAPAQITITNGSAAEITVEMLVARKATP
jgi:hypothetical protein